MAEQIPLGAHGGPVLDQQKEQQRGTTVTDRDLHLLHRFGGRGVWSEVDLVKGGRKCIGLMFILFLPLCKSINIYIVDRSTGSFI